MNDSQGLQRDALTSKNVAIITIAATGPASVVALNFGPMASFAGPAFVFAFVLTLGIAMLLANTLLQLSRKYVSAGSLYSWNVRAFGVNFGFLFGWLFLGAYLTLAAAGFAIFGGWAEQYVEQLYGPHIPWWVFSLPALAFVATMAYRGIRRSVRSALVLLLFELLVLAAFAAWVLLSVDGSAYSFEPFEPGSATGGWEAIGLAMTFGVLSIVGLEQGTTMAEETRDARRAIGRGVVVGALVVTLFYVFTAYACLIGYGSFEAFAEDPAPILTLGERYWGDVGSTLVFLATLSSILAFCQTTFNAGTRVMFALGRERVLPSALAKLHAAYRTPVGGVAAMTAVCVVLAVPFAATVGPFNVWAYFGFLVSILFLLVYAVTSTSLIRLARIDRARFPSPSLVKHALLPLLATAGMLYPLYRTVYPLPDMPYRIMPLIVVGWLVVGALILAHLRRTRRADVERIGEVVAGEAG